MPEHVRECAHCGRRFLATGRIVTCSRFCADARIREQRQASRIRTRSYHVRPESDAEIEARLRAARAARLEDERRTGQRRYTVTDGWAQRPNRCSMDGDLRLVDL